MSGRLISSVMAAGDDIRAPGQVRLPARVTSALNPFLVRQSSRNWRSSIVFDDQHRPVARHDVAAVIGDVPLLRAGDNRGALARMPSLSRRESSTIRCDSTLRKRPCGHDAEIALRQDTSVNVLPSPGCAGQPDFAAEQARDFAADRQAQARAAVLAAGATVGLLERFEDDLLLLRRNADAGVASPRTR